MSTDLFGSIAAQLDPNGVLSVAVDNPDVLRNSGNSLQLTVGQRTKFRATIGGVGYDAYATLRSARLHRISLLEHESKRKQTNNISWLMTGILKPVQIDLELVIGDETISIQEFLRRVSLAKSNSTVSLEQFNMTLEEIGLRFNTGMPLFFQQFGCNKAEFDRIVEKFKAFGAVDVYGDMRNPGRIKEAYQMPNIAPNVSAPGPEVLSFEVNKADRKQSQTYKPELGFYGQGFIDFGDAIVSNYVRCVTLRNTADVLSKSNSERALAENWSSERKEAEEVQVSNLRKLAAKWSSNWAGAQERIIVNPKDSNDLQYAEPREWDPTQLGCGKMTVAFDALTPEAFNFWTDNRPVATATSATAAPAEVEEGPVHWN